MTLQIRAVLAVTIFVLLESLQLLIVLAHLYTFVPIRWSVPVPPGLEPERESFLYIVFLCTAFGAMAAGVRWLLPRLGSVEAQERLWRFIALECFWLALLVFCLFKWTTYRYPFYPVLAYENGAWVWPVFYGVLALSIASKIFWPELARISAAVWQRAQAFSPTDLHKALAGAGVMLALTVLLLPNAREVVAVSYAWDQFNHWDDFFPSRWLLSQGMDYQTLVWIIFAAVMAAWTFIFFCLLRWLKSFWLAVLGVVLGIKLNLFHYAMTPCPWLFPDLTILHLGVDLSLWQGLENAPMFAPLRVRQFFPFFMGFAIPVFYVLNILLRPNKAVVLLALWGLVTYGDYISRPHMFYYGAVIVPALLLACYWTRTLIQRFFPRRPRAILAALALASIGALLTSRVFAVYSHAWDVSGGKFAQERGFYQQFDLSSDVALVGQLTKTDEEVAVVGSFEFALLHEAGRRPFFRQAPLLVSTALASTNVRGLRVKTKAALSKAMEQLAQDPPAHIFLEKRLLGLPQDFFSGPTGLAQLINYIRAHYTPIQAGTHYIAWKRNE